MDIKVPAVGESITEALVAKWLKKDGEHVAKFQPVCEIETDKITLELNAEADGVLSVKVPEGSTVPIGTLIAEIEEQKKPGKPVEQPQTETAVEQEAAPLSPAVRKMAQEKGLRTEEIRGTGRGGRVTVDDLLKEQAKGKKEEKPTAEQPLLIRPEEPIPDRPAQQGREERIPMSPIRRRIAERLLAARQQTAMLTTFNETDMSRVVALKQRHKEDFRKKHGVSLGFMPFFIKACVEALGEFPAVNARIDGDDLVYQHFFDIGVAVSGEKGLVVPVLRNADQLSFAEVEKGIAEFVEKVKTNRLSISDLEGGTFTISNGGVYGSLLSTPILNPPQSGVLGMHTIQERPVARDGKVEIRPMMYLALSYDHRIVDGREAVQFLKRVKGLIEQPEEMLL